QIRRQHEGPTERDFDGGLRDDAALLDQYTPVRAPIDHAHVRVEVLNGCDDRSCYVAFFEDRTDLSHGSGSCAQAPALEGSIRRLSCRHRSAPTTVRAWRCWG